MEFATSASRADLSVCLADFLNGWIFNLEVHTGDEAAGSCWPAVAPHQCVLLGRCPVQTPYPDLGGGNTEVDNSCIHRQV
jgi:hypothetical protein